MNDDDSESNSIKVAESQRYTLNSASVFVKTPKTSTKGTKESMM